MLKSIFWVILKYLSNERGAVGSQDPDPDPNLDPNPNPDPSQQAQFVPLDDFKKLQATLESMNERYNQMQDNFNAVLANRLSNPAASAPAPAEIADVSPEEIDRILAEGQGGAKLLQAFDAKLKKAQKAFDDRLAQIENLGVQSISEVSRSIASTEMPYYNAYKKEIDAYVGQLQPQHRMSKNAYVVAHNAVVGAHLPEILKAEREKVLREVNDPANAGKPTGINARGKESETKVPTVADLLGNEAAQALAGVGRTPDQHAQRMGYKDWATYAEHLQKQNEGAA